MPKDELANLPLAELAERLSLVLDNEFGALKVRDIEALETAQTEKVALLDKIATEWSEQRANPGEASSSDNASLPEVLKTCKEKHARNDIILRRQIEEVRSILNALTLQTSNKAQEVYNKLGKLIG